MRFVAERMLNGWIVESDETERIATFDFEGKDEEFGLYVELRSFDPHRRHLEWDDLRHKRVRITVETID